MVSKNPQKIGKANDMFNLPIVHTQVTLRGNVGSLGGRVLHLEGREWSQKISKK